MGSRSPFAWAPLKALPRAGWAAGALAGGFLAAAYAFQTAGLDLTTVASTGFITGLYVVFTPILENPFTQPVWSVVTIAG